VPTEGESWSRWLFSAPPPVMYVPEIMSDIGLPPSAELWNLMLDKIPGLREAGHRLPGLTAVAYHLCDVRAAFRRCAGTT